MFALGESAERILVLMDSLLSSPPEETPSVKEMFENLEHFIGSPVSSRLELKNRLITLISQSLRLSNAAPSHDVRLVDFLKHVRRKYKAKGSVNEPVSGLETWFSDEKFQQALSKASRGSLISESLRNFSDSRRIMYSGTFVGTDVSESCKAEVTLSGMKYPTPTFDLNIKLYNSGNLEADIFLSELLLRLPWRVAELESFQLDRCLKELVYLGSILLASFRLS